MVDRDEEMKRARHSTELEGGRSSDEARAIQDRWVAGEITTEQLLQETLSLYLL